MKNACANCFDWKECVEFGCQKPFTSLDNLPKDSSSEVPAPTVATDNSGEMEKGLFNGMTAEQLIVWLDRRCGFNDHQKDYVHAILIKLIKSKVTTEALLVKDEEQWELWDLVYNNYVVWGTQEFMNKELLKDFIITRKS